MIDTKKLLSDFFTLNEWFKDNNKEYEKVFKLIEDEFGKEILNHLREGNSIFISSKTNKNRNYSYYTWIDGRKKTWKKKFYRLKEFSYHVGQPSRYGYLEWKLKGCYLKSEVCHKLGLDDKTFWFGNFT